jgi:hypothetical protein
MQNPELETVHLFYGGNFVSYLEVKPDITQDEIVKMATEHLPIGVFNVKAIFCPHKFLNLTKLEK